MQFVRRFILVCALLWTNGALAQGECLPREPYQKLCECPDGTMYEMTCERWRDAKGTICRSEICADCECPAEPAAETVDEAAAETPAATDAEVLP